MIRFINKLTGNEMWVDETRVEEYKAAGHKLAAEPSPKKKTTAKPKSETKK